MCYLQDIIVEIWKKKIMSLVTKTLPGRIEDIL